MRLIKLNIHEFRNYEHLSYDAHPRLNLLVGHNGAGKTNFLDAVYYAAVGRSYFTGLDKEVMRNDSDYMRLDYDLEIRGEKTNVVFKLLRQKGKKLEVDGVEIEKLTDFLGVIRVVMMAPQDAFILLVGNTERRRWLDQLLCQYDANYALALKDYTRLLSRRNAYLKATPPHKADDRLLDTYWDKMEPPAGIIHRLRSELLNGFDRSVSDYYGIISGHQEDVEINYESILDQFSWKDLKDRSRKEEIFSGSTQHGVHKDKIHFQINARKLKYYGSQGQTKSFFLSLKMAELDLLSREDDRPILLIDDVFAKLDASRIERFFQLLSGLSGCQIFMTDTNYERLKSLMTTLNMRGKIQRLRQGRLILGKDEEE
ncbi:MAG: DNA replication and repair protein RecF [Saprospiraceae bacterium]|nr:DNA replication and repair protein RecF [Saprospiraceae bacterium]